MPSLWLGEHDRSFRDTEGHNMSATFLPKWFQANIYRLSPRSRRGLLSHHPLDSGCKSCLEALTFLFPPWLGRRLAFIVGSRNRVCRPQYHQSIALKPSRVCSLLMTNILPLDSIHGSHLGFHTLFPESFLGGARLPQQVSNRSNRKLRDLSEISFQVLYIL